MMKNVNYEHAFVLLIEFKNCLQVAKPNDFETSGVLKSIAIR